MLSILLTTAFINLISAHSKQTHKVLQVGLRIEL